MRFSGGASPGLGKSDAERFGISGASRVDVGDRHVGSGDASREVGDQQADDAGADDEDAVARRGARIPMGIERRFHIGRKGCPPGRDMVRNGQKVRFGDLEMILMRVQRKDAPADQRLRPGRHQRRQPNSRI